ncbi:MAG: hypothetical protein NZ528_14960 [Caldilineales bacterium]|nr:hypothetical protein [Caldilineales bacterium]MDW8317458.1 hypothetical protein [Anaerolineae bacterium]
MRYLTLVSLLVVVALLVSSCGPAVPTAANEMTKSGQRFLLSLPRLEITVDEQGNPSVGGVTLAQISQLIGAQLPEFTINPYYVNWMKLTDVQHIELVHGADGVYLFVNGKQLPSIAWDSESLGNVGQVAGLFNIPFAQLIGTLVPVIERTGLNIVVRFPKQEGAADIPLRDASQLPSLPKPEDEPAAVVARADIVFDEKGIPYVAGLSGQDLANVGIPVPALAPSTMAAVKQFGIREMRIVSGDEGVFISVNGTPLPHIAWNNSFLTTAAELYGQMNPDSPYIALAKLFLPELNNVDMDLTLKFPAE